MPTEVVSLVIANALAPAPPSVSTSAALPPISWLLILVPFLPLLTRGAMAARKGAVLKRVLAKEERDVAGHQNIILVIAGFSLAVLVQLVIAGGPSGPDLRLAIYYSAMSFVGFLAAFLLQAYKVKAWHDQVGTALMEMGSFSLVLSLAAVLCAVFAGERAILFIPVVLALIVWTVDHLIRLRLEAGFS